MCVYSTKRMNVRTLYSIVRWNHILNEYVCVRHKSNENVKTVHFVVSKQFECDSSVTFVIVPNCQMFEYCLAPMRDWDNEKKKKKKDFSWEIKNES